MPLIKCKNCGTEIDALATACLKCGTPAKHSTSMWAVLKWVLIIIVFIPVATCGYFIGTVLYKAERVEIGSE